MLSLEVVVFISLSISSSRLTLNSTLSKKLPIIHPQIQNRRHSTYTSMDGANTLSKNTISSQSLYLVYFSLSHQLSILFSSVILVVGSTREPLPVCYNVLYSLIILIPYSSSPPSSFSTLCTLYSILPFALLSIKCLSFAHVEQERYTDPFNAIQLPQQG